MKRRGTSLVELLIAMTVVAILAAAMTSLLLNDSRAGERTDANREARSVSRSALNILESELRMAEGAGLIAPTDESTITLRQPYAFGLICAATGGGTTVAFLPSADLPSNLVVDGHSGWAWRNATGGYVYEATTTIAAGFAVTCTTAATPITPLAAEGGRVVALPAPSGAPTVGSVAFLYRTIQYSIGPSGIIPGRRGLFRTAGLNGVPEEIAAPFSDGSRFRWYVLDNTVAQDALPLEFDDVRGVQFILNGEGRVTPRVGAGVARSPFSTSIFFQNRPN